MSERGDQADRGIRAPGRGLEQIPVGSRGLRRQVDTAGDAVQATSTRAAVECAARQAACAAVLGVRASTSATSSGK